MNKSKLFVIATPIGNLEDITFRAIKSLKEADFILCEDTRVTGILLKHYEIKKELVSFNAKSENKKIERVIDRINNGETCALVSDAGTPCISDPGVRLINSAIDRGIEIVSIPGASALTAALSIAGLPTDSFIFEGFLPQKKGRQTKLKLLAEESRTIVLYESIHRIEKIFKELTEHMPDRYIVVCRELTKKFEESWRGYPSELLEDIPKRILKGEFVIIIAPKNWSVKIF